MSRSRAAIGRCPATRRLAISWGVAMKARRLGDLLDRPLSAELADWSQVPATGRRLECQFTRGQALPSLLRVARLRRTMNRRPNVVDVVRAVQRIAPAHANVRAWWYAPSRRVGPDAKSATDGRPLPTVVVVERASPGAGSSCEAIARELAEILGDVVVVREHRGELEHEPLIRLVSGTVRSSEDGVALC